MTDELYNRLEKSIRVLVYNVTEADTDSLKMRYIFNFLEKYSRILSAPQEAVELLLLHEADLSDPRDKGMYRVTAYCFSGRDEKLLPEKLEPPVDYTLPGSEINKALASRGIYVSDVSLGA